MEVDKSTSPALMRELGKDCFFRHNGDAEKKNSGLKMLITAQEQGDPEAMYIVARLILDSVLKPVNGSPEERALVLMCSSANKGFVQARAFLNHYCELRYENENSIDPICKSGTPLVDFDGKMIKIDRQGVLSPVDAVLKFEDGRNILSLSTNVMFVYGDEIDDSEKFETAVLQGLMQWQGDYEVFGGQKISVELNITTDARLFDNLIVTPLTGSMGDAILSISNVINSDKRKNEVSNMLTSKRSFATSGLKWSVNSRKIICVQSDDGKFDDYDEIMHVSKHEFGHSLGLGDLYQSSTDSLEGVDKGTYHELDSYAVSNKYYNLVMCDHHGPISNNDIEMVILAFRENKMQLYQPSKLKGKISSALGKGN